jgi:hypothetical protein
MATTRVAHQQAGVSGGTLAWTASDQVNGNNFLPNSGRLVLLQNTSGSPLTVTFTTPGTVAGLAIADDPVTVAATSISVVSITDPSFVSSAGQVDLTSSASVNIAVVQT